MLLIKFYFTVLSVVAPKMAANQAFRFFQKVRKKDIRPREEPFYENAKELIVPGMIKNTKVYISGKDNGKLMLMIHGWDSNPGSLGKVAKKFVELEYKVISLTLPAHGYNEGSYTNMLEAKVALKTLLQYIDPKEAIPAVTHSFGSGVLSYAFSELDYKLSSVVFLTSPNKIMDIFDDFKDLIGLGDGAFKFMCTMTNDVLGERIQELNMADKLKDVDVNRLKIIHDKNDKVIPFKNAVNLVESNKEFHLSTYENIGHYRMLWNEDVIKETIAFIDG